MKELKLNEYIRAAKNLNTDFDKKIKIALLSSFTVQGLKQIMEVKCHNSKVSAQVYNAPYDQYNQELLNRESGLYRFEPDLTFLILDIRSVFRDAFFYPYQMDEAKRREFVSNKCNELLNVAQLFKEQATGKLIITNLSVPYYSPYGIVEEKTPFSFKDMVQDFNQQLKKAYLSDEKVYIYDFNGFVNKFGESHVFDYKLYYLGDIQVAPDYLSHLGEDFMAYVKTTLSLNKKCIVLDLDNTLWGGIIGEDGFEHIHLSPNKPPGNAYYEFQKYLLALYQRGVLLAINSKNNPQDALKVINEHPSMVLREEHFACLKINWLDKASNMREIAKELNIGLNSFIFIDDDPLNRELIKEYIPEILVLDLPKDPSLYVQMLMSLNDLHTFEITQEDKKRSKMYGEQRKRAEFETQYTNIEDFLRGLAIKVEIKRADKFTIPRISQLTLKTNQFNTTTKRYSQEDIKKLSDSATSEVYSVRVEDKFGDNGITGVFIVSKKSDKEWVIDTFLLSCRVIGRKVETFILEFIIGRAKEHKVKRVIGEYISTEKNDPCKDMYEDNGFIAQSDGTFIFDTNNAFPAVDYIESI